MTQMTGSTVDAMAEAVEHACVVIVCMSKRYKESPNCQLEGKYAMSMRKARPRRKTLPIMTAAARRVCRSQQLSS